MRKFKAVICAFLTGTIMMSSAAGAYALPDRFWSITKKYDSAVAGKDNYNIIKYGNETLDLMKNQPESGQKDQIVASRCLEISGAYERLGEFVEAAKYHEIYLPYAERAGWEDGVKIAKDKISAYTPVIDLYTTTTQPQINYGAKNEPELGALFGEVRERTGEEDSMLLAYLELGAGAPWINELFAKARNEGKAVEFALNFPNEADQVRSIRDYEGYLIEILQQIDKFQDVDVYFRVAAEMNIWDNRTDPAEFQEMFKYMYTLIHQYTKNTAVVWSVSHASSWDLKMEDYYPGDEYVDWVGISAYMIPYFQGVKWDIDKEFNDISFTAGRAADPVKVVYETISKYGDRKPIMIAEGGSAHYVKSETVNEDTTDWALVHLRRMYWYIPMVYPQVKLMAYFNVEMADEINNYALHSSERLNTEYHQLIRLPHFIQNGDKAAKLAYRKYENTVNVNKNYTTPLYVYTHLFGDDEPRIEYYIDDVWYSGSGTLPYKIDLDASALEPGTHKLKIVMASEGRVWHERVYNLMVEDKKIGLVINGNNVVSDVPPIIENDRTLVPIRVISENLGADVDWNGELGLVTVKRENTTIQLTIGDETAYQNGEARRLDTPAKIYSDRTYVPLRAVADLLGADVGWDNDGFAAIVNV